MLIIRIHITKISKKFVNTGKCIDTMTHLSSRQTASTVTTFLQTQQKETFRPEPIKGLDITTDRINERQLYADFDIDFERA